MADITAKLILYRLNETLTNMAESILSFFYTDDSKETLDVVNMLFVGWILLGVLVYLLGTFIASHLESVRENVEDEQSKTCVETNEELSKSDEQNNAGVKPKTKSSGAAGTASAGKGSPVSEDEIVVTSISELLGAPRVGVLSHVPVATGTEPGSVRWINSILVWLHTTSKIPLLIDCWIRSINDQAATIAPENGIVVQFNKLSEACPLPELRNVQVSTESNNNVTVTCKILAQQLAFLLNTSRTKGKDKTSADYQLLLERLDGKLKVNCNTEDKLLVVKFVDQPDVKLNLKLCKNGALKESALDQRALEDAITDIAIQALASAVVDLHLSSDPEFPKYVKEKGSISPSSFGSAVDSEASVARHEQRLFVKVIKASNLGADKSCQETYCVVEMDDPSQKFQTAAIKATNSPFWDEHFLFNLKNTSAEVLFEIYDKGRPTGEVFLGLGIVSVEELLKNPSQRQIISLQSRPLENDKVSGSLTAEFLFMEGSEIPIRQQHGRTVETNSRVTSGGKIITTTTIKKSEEEVCNGISASQLTRMDSQIKSAPEKDLPSSDPCPPPISNSVQCIKSSTLPRGSKDNLFTYQNGNLNGPLSDLKSQSDCFRSSAPNLFLKPNFEAPVIKPDFDKITLLKKSPPSLYNRRLKKCVSQDISSLFNDNVAIRYRSYENILNDYAETNNNIVEEKNWVNDNVKNSERKVVNNFLVDIDRVILPNTDWKSSAHQMVVEISPVKPSFDQDLDLPSLELPNTPLPLPEAPATSKSTFSLAILSKGPALQVTPSSPNDTIDSVNEGSNPNESIETESGSNKPKSDKKLKGRKWLMSKFKSKKKKDGKDAVDDSVPLMDTALKEIEQMGKTGMSTNKSTLIIHSVQREVVRPTLKVKVDKDGRWHEVPAPEANGDKSGSGSPSSPTPAKGVPSAAESASSSDKEDRSARQKERKSFMGTLRKRLSFKKNRSKSVDPNADGQQSPNSSRSASADRSKSVPGSREQSMGRHPSHLGVPGGGSTRSSLSEGSGFSGASSRTYINENSTLVIEITENGITKHYLIPFSLASRSKWRKRGVKLHIYNDHTFVAKHISGSVICQVCTRHFPRRPGKQAYSCRDCDLQCHKTCHVKIDSRCPNSTIHSLEMEYVQDPRIKSTSS